MNRDEIKNITRKFIQYIPQNRRYHRGDDEFSFNNYMFAEDVKTHLIPYSDDAGKFEIVGGELDEKNKILILFDNLSQFSNREITEFFIDVFRGIGSRIAHHGRIYCEISQAEVNVKAKSNSSNNISLPYLETIPGIKIKFGKSAVQLFPMLEMKSRKKIFVRIPKMNAWIIDPPKILGGYKGYILQKLKLSQSSATYPKYIKNNVEKMVSDKNLNISDFHKQKTILKMSSTKKWGWHGRLQLGGTDNFSEYYNFYKQLTFDLAMAILREHILDEINKLLKNLKYSSRLTMIGFHTPNEVQEKIDLLDKGEIVFEDVMDFIY